MSGSRSDPLVEIAAALRRMTHEQRDFLIVTSDQARNYYVQLALRGQKSPESLVCEAVSDQWLEPENQLGEAGTVRLRSLGWRDPSADWLNWSREFPLQEDEDHERIAATLVETLREVYGYTGGKHSS